MNSDRISVPESQDLTLKEVRLDTLLEADHTTRTLYEFKNRLHYKIGEEVTELSSSCLLLMHARV